MKKPLIVLRSNDNCFLDILRACGSCGIAVIPVIFSWEGAGIWNSERSRYFCNPFRIANPAENEQKAIEDMILLGKKLLKVYKEKLIVISSSDTNLYFMQKNFDVFRPYFFQMGHEDFEKDCMQELKKNSSAKLLLQERVEIPLTYEILTKQDIDYAVSHITFPCVYKPVIKDLTSSFQNTHKKKKAIECHEREELRSKLLQEVGRGYELIVQEKIEFEDIQDEVSCYVYANRDGKILAISGQHKIQEWPYPYGTGIISRPYMDKKFMDIAQKIVIAYKWRGFMGIEFMKNKKTGNWVVIEINLRPWISINFQATLGFNYIKLLYEDFYKYENTDTKIMDDSFSDIYRLNLTALVEKEMACTSNERKAFYNIGQLIKENMGKIIFSYYTWDDEEPGLAEKEKFIDNYPDCICEIEEVYCLIKENNNRLKKYIKSN